MSASIVRSIPCKLSELRLDKTLACGQSFRWRELSSGVWIGVMFDRIWKLWQTESDLYYQVFGSEEMTTGFENASTTKPDIKNVCTNSTTAGIAKKLRTTNSGMLTEAKSELCKSDPAVNTCMANQTTRITSSVITEVKVEKDNLFYTESPTCNSDQCELDIKSEKGSNSCYLENVIFDYFQLSFNLPKLYAHWSNVDHNFEKVSADFEGIRILRQDPVENLFAFICSSNNNISRISGMVEKLCENYGREVGNLDGKTYYAFPPVSALCEDGVEEELRNLGFGYRARYINESAKQIQKYGVDWLSGLRQKSYKEAKAELMTLCGVGAKVADCVCLMSLDKLEAVPVDTHVWQIAARHYMPQLNQNKSLTDKLYVEIADHFRNLWGEYAGWAQSVLFTADLRQFKSKPESPTKKRKATKAKSNIPEKNPTLRKSRK